jgi:hypothetical protein
MSGAVINPMIFYWMDIVQNLDVVVNIIWISLACVLFTRPFLYINGVENLRMSENFHTKEFKEEHKIKGEAELNLSTKWLKPNIIIIIVCLIITTFIPSYDTMITMLVADMITYENIELTKESAIALIDYIIEQVETITG